MIQAHPQQPDKDTKHPCVFNNKNNVRLTIICLSIAALVGFKRITKAHLWLGEIL
jgi:hypothetical protein